MIRFVSISLLLALAAACTVTPAPEPLPQPQPIPPDPWAPPPDPSGPPTVERACARLLELDCPSGKPTPDGTPCTVFLRDALESGLVAFDLGCLVALDRCDRESQCAGRP